MSLTCGDMENTYMHTYTHTHTCQDMKQSKRKKAAIEQEGAKDKGGDVENTAMQLESRIESMVEKIQKDLTKVEESIGAKLHLLDADNDGVSAYVYMCLCVYVCMCLCVYVCMCRIHECMCRSYCFEIALVGRR